MEKRKQLKNGSVFSKSIRRLARVTHPPGGSCDEELRPVPIFGRGVAGRSFAPGRRQGIAKAVNRGNGKRVEQLWVQFSWLKRFHQVFGLAGVLFFLFGSQKEKPGDK
ncbi:hypothetical protein AVEN_211095-1 [Araneus ventricosus]|uniref:Uncharacterized protein n=1 Tax=Araneus ventricosus TaxID=182803 RepID=A0A4Y2GSN3_ARAVE|nr:hypothetical protein AVEN_211095-1 [Araneus ventricosus]